MSLDTNTKPKSFQRITEIILSTQFVKFLFTFPFFFALYIYREDIGNPDDPSSSFNSTEKGSMYVVIALASHPPSLRVFRGISEMILLLICTAISLRVWEGTLGQDMIGYLLFQPEQDGGYASFWKNQLQTRGGVGNSSSNSTNVSKHELVEEGAVLVEDVSEEEDDDDDEIEQDEEFDTHIRDGPTMEYFRIPQPPSSSSVAGAALDLLLFFLICLLLFTYAHTTDSDSMRNHSINSPIPLTLAGIAAPIFPLILFLGCGMAALTPWSKRHEFLQIVRRTIEAPFFSVTFRDGFVGDILTSTVRPLQDLTFTLFYLFSGLQGWWSSQYTLDQAAAPVEHSWLVYTVLLPACMASPLWWRFLQNLRQVHDEKQRWPYLGNALKYFLAAQVALFGVFTPSLKKSRIWIGSFVLATLYQIWWDTFMDWNLLVRTNDQKWTLRSKRMYPYKSLYYTIFGLNMILRFCWTLSFLPPQTLSNAGIIVDTFGSDFETFISPILATAEILRRTLWGLLRVEWEAIKTMDQSPSIKQSKSNHYLDFEGMEMVQISHDDEDDDDPGLRNMSIESSHDANMHFHVISTTKLLSPFSMIQNDLSNTSDMLILGELCLWATAFTSVGIFAAAYRQA